MFNRKSIPPAAGGLICLIAVWLGSCCSGPAVRHSAIGGEIRTVEAWIIKLNQSPAELVPSEGLKTEGQIDKIREDRFQYAAVYLDEVEKRLRNMGHITVDSSAPGGTIAVKFGWREKATFRPNPTTPGIYEDEEVKEKRRRGDEVEADHAGWDIPFDDLFESTPHKVNRVEVEIIGAGGQSLGQAVIGGNYNDNIRPKKIAEILHKLIRQGKY